MWTEDWKYHGLLKNRPRRNDNKKNNGAKAPLFGAGDEARTRYLHLGKVALYRMSYARVVAADYDG